jgi:hypothetical protein
MAAWKELHKHKRFPKKLKSFVLEFKQVWTQGNLFCKDSSLLQSQILPNKYSLPKHMADREVGLTCKQHVQVFNEISSNFGMEDSNGVDGNGRSSNLGHVGDIADQIL